MRFTRWLAFLVSLGMLVMIGGIGWRMNVAAQQTAESIHRRDTAELVRNNAMLASQYLLLSAKELADFSGGHGFRLAERDTADAELLAQFQRKAVFFPYGAVLADLNGRVLNARSQAPGLPPATDPGYVPMRAGLKAGGPGFSSVMTAGGVPLVAVAVPVVAGGQPRGLMIGYTKIETSQLQAYLSQLGGAGETRAILDNEGVFTAASDPARLGTPVEPEVRAAIANATPLRPFAVEFTRDGVATVAFVTTGMQGGWISYQSRTSSVFYGPIRSRGLKTNLALLGLILVAGAALAAMNHRAETVRRRSEERFRALVQNAMDVITVLGPAGRITFDSPSVTSVLGFHTGARLGELGADTLHPDDQHAARDLFARVLADPDTRQRLQCRVRRADGSYLWADLSITNLLDNPAVGGIVVNARDISESRDLQEQMSHQASHDALTGLPNRRFFNDRLSSTLRPPAATDAGRTPADDTTGAPVRATALIFIDLDQFKPVNDRLGHEAGDDLLRQVSERFLACVRPTDTLARVGGDEFIIVIDDITQVADATRVAARLIDALAEPFRLGEHEVRVGASVGVSLAGFGEDPDDALRRADSAMYRAKQSGGGRYELCGEDLVAA